MKGLGEFVKATVIGGVLVILPIALTVGLIGKAVATVLSLLSPIAHLLPGSSELIRAMSRTPPGSRSGSLEESA